MGAYSRRALLFAAANAWFASGCSLVSLDALTEGAGGAATASSTTAAASSASSSGAGGQAGMGGASSAGGGGSGSSASSASSGGKGGSDGLIGHWPLDDGAGTTAADASGIGNDGFLVDGPTWTSGMFGGALAFVGDTGRMEVPGLSGPAFPEAGTLSLWFDGAFVDGAEASSRGIFDNYGSGRAHLFVRRANGSAETEIQVAMQPADAGPYVFVIAIPVTAATWHHVVVVWDCALDTVVVYVDGAAHPGVIDDPAWTPNEQEFRFGGNYVGAIDEVRLYDRPLSVEEVAAL